jgi:hypothetical protein
VQDTIDEQRARCLVELVFHGLAAGRHFDDDVQVLGRVLAVGMRSIRMAFLMI